jgi:hypothetical protein
LWIVSGPVTARASRPGTGIGTFIEVYDLLIYGYLAAILAQRFFPPSFPEPCC